MPVAVEAEPIQYEVDGHVARIWLNRPHKRNSVSQQLLQELDEARIRAENDPNIGVIVISSELPEVIGICDRVLVMREGHIEGEVGGPGGQPITQENIMAYAAGVAA